MPADTQLVATPPQAGSSVYTLPPNLEFRLKAVRASFDGSAANPSWLPAVIITSDSAHGIADAVDTDNEVAAGASAVVSFFPRRRRVIRGSGTTLDYRVGEIGHANGTTQASTQTSPLLYQDIAVGEGILVLAMAPSRPSALATPGTPTSLTDTAGNTYFNVYNANFEASPPNVNEGVRVQLFYCLGSRAAMRVGVDSFTATWDNPVFDRVVEVWNVRHTNPTLFPGFAAATPDNDAAVFASSQVTLHAPTFTPVSDDSLYFALIISAKVGGVGGFGGAAGFNGFFQAIFRSYGGSKQTYLVNQQTAGANAYLIASASSPAFEDDIGTYPINVAVPGFNGVGQSYSAGANAWKGIILLSIF